jgi:hypothetical protein
MTESVKLRVARLFGAHLMVFLLANAVLTGTNIYTGSPWWAFWPLVVWSILLMVHYLFHRTATVDDAWVEERTLDLHSKSYDAGHIDDIRGHPAPSIQDERRDAGKG